MKYQYDYKVKLVWKCDFADESNTKVIGSIEGEYECPEISSDILDDGDEWEINCQILKGDETLRGTLYQVVKKYAPEAMRKAIVAQFVDELKKK